MALSERAKSMLKWLMLGAFFAVAIGAQYLGLFDLFTGGEAPAAPAAPTPADPTDPANTTAADDRGIGQWFGMVAILVAFAVFALLGRALLRESFEDAGSNTRYRTALNAALILSGLSFFTTAAGLYEFTEPETNAWNVQIVSWILSFATTAGVQILMLVLALELGDRIVRLRPMHVSKTNGLGANGHAVPHGVRMVGSQDAAKVIVAVVLLAIATSFLGLWSIKGLFGAVGDVYSGGEQPRFLLAAVFGAIGLALLAHLGWIGNLFSHAILAFLAIVYAGTLMVSSLFSFDAYYKFVQSEEQIKLEAKGIVGDETAKAIVTAKTVLDEELIRAGETLESSDVTEGLRAGIRELVLRSDEFKAQIQSQREELLAEAEDEIARLQDRTEELEKQKAAARDGLNKKRADVIKKGGQIRVLEEQLPSFDGRIKTQREVADKARQEAEAQKLEAEAQASGLDGRNAGEGPLYRAAKRQAERLEKIAREREGELKKLTAEKSNVEGQISTLKNEITALQEDITRAEAAATTTSISTDTPTAADTQKVIENRIREIEASRASINAADASALSTSLEVLLSNPTQANRDAYLTECAGLKKVLLDVKADVETVSGFSCAPSRFSGLVARVFDLQARVKAYEIAPNAAQPAADGAPDAPQTPTAATRSCDDGVTRLDTSEALLLARRCVETVGADVPGQSAISRNLSLTESIYTKPGYDIRKSVINVTRGEPYAVFSAGFALFIDLVILFSGIYIAVSKPSPFTEDPNRPIAHQIERNMLRMAVRFDNGGSGQAVLRRLADLIAPRDDHGASQDHFNHVVPPGLSKDDMKLVKTMLSIAGRHLARYEASSEARARRAVELHDNLVAFINEKAYAPQEEGEAPETARTARARGRLAGAVPPTMGELPRAAAPRQYGRQSSNAPPNTSAPQGPNDIDPNM